MVTKPVLGLLEHYKQFPEILPHRKSLQAYGIFSRRAAGGDVEPQPMRWTVQQIALKLTACQRGAIVRTRVIDGVDGAIDVEQDDETAIDKGQLALAGH